DNLDFNSGTDAAGGYPPGSNYAYKDAGSKIFAGPLWDFDLAASVSMSNYPKHFYRTSEPIKPKNVFYQKLWDDNQFRCKFKEAWTDNKSFFETIPAFIDSISEVLAPHAQANFTTGLYETTSSYKPTIPKTEAEYKTEVGKLKTWWNSRMTFFNTEVNNLSASSCVKSPSSSSAAPSSSSTMPSSSSATPSSSSNVASSSSSASTSAIPIKAEPSAIVLQNVPEDAKIEIYSLQGKRIYSRDAMHRVSTRGKLQIPVQTKGIYIVKVSFGSEKRIFKVSVR
ncbi:MAG: T9SS type A sorting domain-containing protein, partial [Fibromonadales bacterium]|nr:T9SS type A sorting domain-containing protein [Fibromonadales bacterium]